MMTALGCEGQPLRCWLSNAITILTLRQGTLSRHQPREKSQGQRSTNATLIQMEATDNWADAGATRSSAGEGL